MSDEHLAIGTAHPDQVSNAGATVRPIYGQRCPMMYHLFETEMKQISALNAIALAFFSIGSFVFSVAIGITINGAFSTSPPPLGQFLYTKVVCWLVITTVLLFGFGTWAIITKKSAINLIKKETRSPERTN
jgi:hypothetical protein